MDGFFLFIINHALNLMNKNYGARVVEVYATMCPAALSIDQITDCFNLKQLLDLCLLLSDSRPACETRIVSPPRSKL